MKRLFLILFLIFLLPNPSYAQFFNSGSPSGVLYDPAGSAAAAAAASIPLTIITAEGDLIIGTGPGAVTVYPKGLNNCIYGWNNAGVFGCWQNFTPVLNSTPTADNTFTGTITTLVAGEALAQWDVVYCKPKAGVHACYKYDADGADKAKPPRYMVTDAAGIAADAAGVFLVEGIVRHDAWAQVTNQDEGTLVYGSTTAGGIVLTAPAVSGDMVVILGNLIEENIFHFDPCRVLVEVP